jgi:hypothetical protein
MRFACFSAPAVCAGGAAHNQEIAIMESNVCGTEKVFRALLGIVIIAAGIFYGSWWGAIGLIPLLTAVIGYCPVSHALHFTSCSVRTSN